jgi:phosphoglycolate phosphatase-like HAD superfamily hydrolase
MENSSAHVVWDWNGTLFHDTEAVIEATNATFQEIGLAPITLEQYRELYCVPVPRFYERLMGRLPTEAEWKVMDESFQRNYMNRRADCGLAEGVEELLTAWRAAGNSQSILSMYRHEELTLLIKRFGIEGHFIRVDGHTGASGGGKADLMVRHLTTLTGVDPARTIVIGDAADDAVAARHVGAHAVLYTGGSHSRASLAITGAPVVDSLAEALREAQRLVAS